MINLKLFNIWHTLLKFVHNKFCSPVFTHKLSKETAVGGIFIPEWMPSLLQHPELK